MESELSALKTHQAEEMNSLMDEILDNSCHKIQEAVDHFQDPLFLGNQSSTPQYTLAQAERFSALSKFALLCCYLCFALLCFALVR